MQQCPLLSSKELAANEGYGAMDTADRPRHRKLVKHYHEPGDFHELTFSCYKRTPLLTNDDWRRRLSRQGTIVTFSQPKFSQLPSITFTTTRLCRLEMVQCPLRPAPTSEAAISQTAPHSWCPARRLWPKRLSGWVCQLLSSC